ncbi:MAG TPA: hypothetical protein IAA58_11505 [Candidatus Gallacutalibacter stercoravium]|nr:hypothetical protein [Candidatus Gallacutalibacter stercoravium]
MDKQTLKSILQEKEGILPLIPVFVPRRFGTAGRRLRLHPDDYFALGTQRGSIKERWFSSIICAMNGPLAAPDEGMSYVDIDGQMEHKVSLKEFVDTLGADLLGDRMMQDYGTWPMYSKFFDYEGPLFHHLHLSFEDAARVGRLGKPEAYYFPPQLNNYAGTSPYTYFGFAPDVTKEEVKERLADFCAKDTRITELSRAYRIELGTGWYTAPGVVHAPGSYLTYEPQWNSDVNSVYENVVENEIYPYDMLVENCPEDKKQDLDYVISLMDWDKNVDPDYRRHFFRPPVVATEDENHIEKWISYGNPYIAAKELTVYPGCEAVISDDTPYGCILTQGHGVLNGHNAEAACMLRFGQMSADEYFVSYDAAHKGVRVRNLSQHEPLVMLKHFPYHPGVPQAKA